MMLEVPSDVMETLRYYQLFYLRSKNPGKKIDKQNLALDELLEFWTSELKNLNPEKPQEKHCIPFAKKGYEDIHKAIKRYL